jgi:hypothetical protein
MKDTTYLEAGCFCGARHGGGRVEGELAMVGLEILSGGSHDAIPQGLFSDKITVIAL